MTQQIFINGDADEIQLRVQGHSDQDEPLQTWEDSTGAVLAQVTGDGRFEIGDTASMTTDESLIEAQAEGTSASDIQRGVNAFGKFTGAISNGIAWVMSQLNLAPQDQNVSGVHAALRAKVVHENTTDADSDSSAAKLRAGDFEAVNENSTSNTPVGEMTGVQGRVDNQTDSLLKKATGVAAQIANGSGTADIETAIGFEVLPPVNGNVIDILIGLDIADMDEGTENFAIRTGAGKVKLGVLTNGLVKSVGSELANAVQGTDYDKPMVGATALANGQAGIVPQPLIANRDKFLRGDGTWSIPTTNNITVLNDLTDVDTSGADVGDILVFDGTQWIPQVPSGGALPLDDLADVDTTGASDGDVLTYNSTAEQWIAQSPPVPIGSGMPYFGATAPLGWLMCDGTAVSRAVYAGLLAVIGDVFKQFTSLATRTSDTAGTTDLGYSSHGLTTSNATLTLRFALANAIISAVNTTSDVITTSAAHLFDTGDKVQVSSTGTLPGGLSASTDYYVRSLSGTTLSLHPTLTDAQNNTNLINLTSAGTGTHTIIPQDEASRTGVPITNVSGSVLTFSGGSGHILPVAGTAISVECDSGMFFLPDMRGRVAVGGGQGNGLTNRSRGEGFGEENHQLTEAELAAHQHNFLGLEDGTDTAGFNAVYRAKWTRDVSGTSTNRFSTAYMQASGSNTPHNNMQPSLVLNYIIKA